MAISTRCAHLGCPVRYIRASQKFVCPCHGGVYDFQGKVVGGPPVRPLDRFYTRVRRRPGRDRRPLLARTPSSSASRRATRRTISTGCGSTSTRRGRPHEAAAQASDAPPRPAAHRRQPATGPGNGRTATAPTARSHGPKDHAVEGVRRRRRLARRAHRRQPVPARLPLPQGPEGHELVLHARARPRCSPSCRRRSRACSWRCTTSRNPTRAYYSASHITNDVFLGEFVRGMHKWGSTVMIILIFLHMGAHVLLRRLQVPARAELGDRRGADRAHAA